MKKIRFILVLFVFFKIANPVNCLSRQLVIDTTTVTQKKNILVNNYLGTWCLVIKNKIDFSVNIVTKNDSLFCSYRNVIFNGKYLNSSDGAEDWAFEIPNDMLKDTSLYIVTKNFFAATTFHLKIKYDAKQKSLIWQTLENEYPESMIVPSKVKLSRCQ
jgi:hypothetical protein